MDRMMSLETALGNLGAELSRALDWRARGHQERELASLERALALAAAAVGLAGSPSRRRELCRAKEVLGAWYSRDAMGEAQAQSLIDDCTRYASLVRR